MICLASHIPIAGSPSDAQSGVRVTTQPMPGPVRAAFREFYYLLVAQYIFGQLTTGHQKSWRLGSIYRKSDTQLTVKMIRVLLLITLMLTLVSAVPKPMSDMEIYT